MTTQPTDLIPTSEQFIALLAVKDDLLFELCSAD